MDLIGEERSRLARAAGWLDASRAETLGLAVLLIGSLAATLVLVWAALGRPNEIAGQASPDAGAAAAGDPARPDDHAGHGHLAPGDHGDPGTGGADVGVGGVTDPADDGTATAPDAGPTGEVTVHVAGAVTSPGVVTLPTGARVGDAIDAAGGPTADADPSLVNLARPLVDGEQVRVPREGEDPPPEPPAGPAPGGGEAPTAAGGRVDVNRASPTELETLPGIGPALAARIVAHRDQHGPFREPGDLRDVSGIGEKRFQDLADLVTVG